ncbi:hypothetical protein AMTRI_Chr13g121010 [Amborella trichopoda]
MGSTNRILERFYIDLVVGESLIKERAATRFEKKVGSTDVVAGEPLLLLPRRFRQNRALMELNKIWRMNKKVKGFLLERVKGIHQRISNDRFTIESINPKRTNIVVWCSNSGSSNKSLMSPAYKKKEREPIFNSEA